MLDDTSYDWPGKGHDRLYTPHFIEGVMFFTNKEDDNKVKYFDSPNCINFTEVTEEEAFKLIHERKKERKRKEKEKAEALLNLELKVKDRLQSLLTEVATVPMSTDIKFYSVSDGDHEAYGSTTLFCMKEFTKKQFCEMYNAAIVELGGGKIEERIDVVNKMCELFGFQIVDDKFEIRTRFDGHHVLSDESMEENHDDEYDWIIEHYYD